MAQKIPNLNKNDTKQTLNPSSVGSGPGFDCQVKTSMLLAQVTEQTAPLL
uniref:Uncharacterized protein n=1 Tax=Anguilla anguilla TaxID=7936 RepID=A0A0E9PLC3_ANGAN